MLFKSVKQSQVKLHYFTILALTVRTVCTSFGQVVLTLKNDDGLCQAGESAVWIVKPAPQSSATSDTYTACKNSTANPCKQGKLGLSSGSCVTTKLTFDGPGANTLDVPLQAAPASAAECAQVSKHWGPPLNIRTPSGLYEVISCRNSVFPFHT